jgi:hypothetical protein
MKVVHGQRAAATAAARAAALAAAPAMAPAATTAAPTAPTSASMQALEPGKLLGHAVTMKQELLDTQDSLSCSTLSLSAAASLQACAQPVMPAPPALELMEPKVDPNSGCLSINVCVSSMLTRLAFA